MYLENFPKFSTARPFFRVLQIKRLSQVTRLQVQDGETKLIVANDVLEYIK